jgi:endonuclease/exonuclease/phosphatase family metal-dependent hydrolase
MKSKIIELKIMQWNMGDSSHAVLRPNDIMRSDILSDLLYIHNPIIVTLQEANRVVLSNAKLFNYEIFYGLSGLVTLLRKGIFYHVDARNIGTRAHGLSLNNLHNRQPILKIVNIHLPILNLDIVEKRERARKFINESDSWRAFHDPRFEILSGDLNMPPYDEVMMVESGFCSNRDLNHIIKKHRAINKYIYNCTWKVFGGGCGSLGTYYLNNVPHGPWHLPDQILIDPRIVENNRVDVEIITSVNSQTLITKSGIPNKRVASDHLPLLVTTDLDIS